MSSKNRNRLDNIIERNGIQYKLVRIIDKTATNIHHIIWQWWDNKKKFNVQHPKNKVRVNVWYHDALNRFFKDKQNPRLQLIEIFELVKPVLSRWVKDELYTILYKTDDEMFYDSDLIKKCTKTKKSRKSN